MKYRSNITALLACAFGILLSALLPETSTAQVANGRATTAAPTYTNNTTAPLSLDLSGNLRVAIDAVNDAVQVVGNVASGAADSGNPVKIGGIFQTTPSTVTNGQRSNIQVDANGNQRITPVQQTVTGADNIANTALSGTLPAASSSVATQLQPVAGFVFDGSTWDRMPGTSAGGVSTTVVAALPAGNNNIGDVDVASIAAGTNLIGSTGFPTDTTLLNHRLIAANTTNSTSVKGSAGSLSEITLSTNTLVGTDTAWLKLYNSASAPTCGSGTPVATYAWPRASASTSTVGTVSIVLPYGKYFSTGIGYCITSSIGDSDTTAVVAATFIVNLTYK